MNPIPYFEVTDEYAVFRPVGEVTLEEAMGMIEAAILTARDRRISKLLVITNSWNGMRITNTIERYFYVAHWAEKAAGTLRIAVVAKSEFIDPEKFGVTVARNRGLVANVFASETEAVAWLKSI